MVGLRLLLLAGALLALSPCTRGSASRAAGPCLRVQTYEVLLDPEPAMPPVDPVAGSTELVEVLDSSIFVNREAAAQVALVGLAEVSAEQRAKIAQAAATWMGQAVDDLPQAGPYRMRQRAILNDWKRALEGYAAGQAGSLGRIRAASQANAVLYADMLRHRAEAQKNN